MRSSARLVLATCAATTLCVGAVLFSPQRARAATSGVKTVNKYGTGDDTYWEYVWRIDTTVGIYTDIHIDLWFPDRFGEYEALDTSPATSASISGSTLIIDAGSNPLPTPFNFIIRSKEAASGGVEGGMQRVRLSNGGTIIPGSGAQTWVALPPRPMTPGSLDFLPGETELVFGPGSFGPGTGVELLQYSDTAGGHLSIGSGTAGIGGACTVSLSQPLTGGDLLVSANNGMDGFIPVAPANTICWDGQGDGTWGAMDSTTGNSQWLLSCTDAGYHFPSLLSAVTIEQDTVTVSEDRLSDSLDVQNGGAVVIDQNQRLYLNSSTQFGSNTVLDLGSASELGVGTGGGVLDGVSYGTDATIVGNVTVNRTLIPHASEGPMLFVEGSLDFGENSFYPPALKGDWSSQVHVSDTARLDGGAWLEVRDAPPTYGDHTVVVLTATRVEGTFDTPPAGTYLGDPGVFLQDVGYHETYVDMTVLRTIPGDCDGDRQVTNADFATVAANWRVYYGWENGDFDGDDEIGNSDMAEVMARWGSSVADYVGILGGPLPVPPEQPPGGPVDRPDRADLLYDPQTGNVKLDPTETAAGTIINFILENAEGGADFVAPGTAAFPWSQRPMPFIVDEPLEVSESDQFMMGFDTVWDLGDIFPPGMSLAELDAFLTRATYVGGFVDNKGTGMWEFDLIPEPSALALLALGAAGLAVRKRRH